MKQVKCWGWLALLSMFLFVPATLATPIGFKLENITIISHADGKVLISGVITSGVGQRVTALITDEIGRLQYINQKTSTEEGHFSFSFQTDGSNDTLYYATISGQNVAVPLAIPFTYEGALAGLTVTIQNPENGDVFVEGSDIMIVAQVSGDIEKIEKVEFYNHHLLLPISNISHLGQGQYGYQLEETARGNYVFTVKAYPEGGNPVVSAPVSITVGEREVEVPLIVGGQFTDRLIGDGNIVTSLTPGEGLKSHITIQNNSNMDLPATLIVALYNGSEQVEKIAYVEKVIKSESTHILTAGLDLPEDLSGYVVKAFVWDSITNMRPYSNVLEIQ